MMMTVRTVFFFFILVCRYVWFRKISKDNRNYMDNQSMIGCWIDGCQSSSWKFLWLDKRGKSIRIVMAFSCFFSVWLFLFFILYHLRGKLWWCRKTHGSEKILEYPYFSFFSQTINQKQKKLIRKSCCLMTPLICKRFMPSISLFFCCRFIYVGLLFKLSFM